MVRLRRWASLILVGALLLYGCAMQSSREAALPLEDEESAPEEFSLEPPDREPAIQRTAGAPEPEEGEPPGAFEPLPTPTLAVRGTPTGAPGPLPPQQDALPAGVREPRWVWLEFPRWLPVGRSSSIRLTLAIEGDRIAATAEIEGSEVVGEPVEIPDAYETHRVYAIASLYAAGLTVLPQEPIEEPLRRGQSVTFRWNVAADNQSPHVLTATLRLRYEPKMGGPVVEEKVWDRLLELDSRGVWGFLPTPIATTVGTAGSLLGGLLGFPFLKEVLQWLLRRRRRAD